MSSLDGVLVVRVDVEHLPDPAGLRGRRVNGEVWVDRGEDITGGMYALEEVSFLPEDRPLRMN